MCMCACVVTLHLPITGWALRDGLLVRATPIWHHKGTDTR
jgi:hypothetical protein